MKNHRAALLPYKHQTDKGFIMSETINEVQAGESRDLVDYFERGCVCLLTSKFEKSDNKDPVQAAAYYMDKCTCSRHPESATRHCWDKTLGGIDKAVISDMITEKGDSFDADGRVYK